MEMNVQSASESLFLRKQDQLQKQVLSLKCSEVHLSIDIKHVGVITMGSM